MSQQFFVGTPMANPKKFMRNVQFQHQSGRKTGIFVIYFEVVRSIRGFEIGWYLLGTCFGYLPKTKKQVPVQKTVWESRDETRYLRGTCLGKYLDTKGETKYLRGTCLGKYPDTKISSFVILAILLKPFFFGHLPLHFDFGV